MHGPLACAAWLAAGGGAVRACSKAGGRRRGRARPCPPASGGQRRGLRSHPRWLGQIRRRPAVPFPPTRTPTRSPISAGTSSLTCHARRRQELHAEPPPRPRSALVDPKNRLPSSPWCSSPLSSPPLAGSLAGFCPQPWQLRPRTQLRVPNSF